MLNYIYVVATWLHSPRGVLYQWFGGFLKCTDRLGISVYDCVVVKPPCSGKEAAYEMTIPDHYSAFPGANIYAV